ncbi:ABC transporter ATP-binding protein [Rossellomorea vietnamensis]|uniref:ABC transporter ATP-binding protein n=1 Tax=Rossellomorea vietnamensis TaxID=218284 RepID=UPI003D2CFB4B
MKLAWTEDKLGFLIQFTFKVLLGIIPLISIWLFESLIDSISYSISQHVFVFNIILFLLGLSTAAFVTFLLNKFSEIFKSIFTYKLESKLKVRIFEDAINIPYIKYENAEFQNQLSRALGGQKNIINIIDSSFTVIQHMVSIFSIMAYLVRIDYLFIMLIIIMIFPLYIIEVAYGKKRFDLNVRLTEIGREEGYLESLLVRRESLKEVRINSLEDFLISKWKSIFLTNSKARIKLDIKQSKWLIFSNLILFISFLGSGTYVYFLILGGSLSIGIMVAVLQSIQRLQGIVGSFTGNLANFYELSLYVGEFLEFVPKYTQSQNNKRHLTSIDSIEVKNLTFTYPGLNHETLKGIDLTIKRDKKIAIIGSNGAGKTTLIKCLLGLYSTKNEIFINGIYEVNEISRKSLFNRMSVLFQDFNKYEFNVKENISSSNISNAKDIESMNRYTSLTGIHDYLESLPQGYESMLGRLFHGANELSGGQWQKLAIARALFKEGDILFLDEPTSALDPDSEYYLIKNLLEIITNIGLVYITHRVNVAKLADEIIYMKGGEVIEKGSHAELIRLGGEYYKLYQKQVELLVSEKKEGIYA